MNLAPHPFSLRQLQYCVAVADKLSFRRAAEQCHVSQPSLSAQVAELEEALGARLFERSRRRVLVTAAGRELVRRAEAILVSAGDLADAAKRLGDPLSGTFRIGAIPTISPYLLPLVTPKLRACFRRMTFAWLEDKTATLVSMLQDGSLDAALVALEADVGDVEHEVIAKDAFVLATPPGHPLAKSGGPAALEHLRGSGVLLLDEGHCFRDQALSFCQTARARELEFRATSLCTLVQMVAGGAGLTLLPALSVSTEAGRARVVVRAFEAPAPCRTIAMVWRRQSPLGATLRLVARAVRDSYPEPARRPRGHPATRGHSLTEPARAPIARAARRAARTSL